MGLFDKIGSAIGGALESIGSTAGTLLEGIAPVAATALGARVAEKLGPRPRAMPGQTAFPLPQPGVRRPVQTFVGVIPSGGDMVSPFGSGPFLPQVQQASFAGPIIRQLPSILGGAAGGAVAEQVFSGGAPALSGARMPGGIAINSFFKMTPTGRMSPNRVVFAEDGQGRGAFFVNAGTPKTWSKVTLKSPRRCRPR